ncbi:MAG: glycoside hydrolase family 43 protein [Spirochaetales bacterium]|nr:glycoside hydrolase family 43 protein [Spirochaetales bacterium]
MSTKPIITHLFTADPSAHVFDDRIYVYPSHDRDIDAQATDEGDEYQMVDYHVFSMEEAFGPVTDHGCVLHVKDVPWAAAKMWAPDAAKKNGKYYFYFPAKDKDEIFRIGVATGDSPAGPFSPQPRPMKGSYSIDPAVFVDDDGQAYIYFGGIWGGQLQNWVNGSFDPDAPLPEGSQPALSCKMAKLTDDMLEFGEELKDAVILGPDGKPVSAQDEERRFFEGPWMHKYNGLYYFSYSTGTTHLIAYATSESPYGPFTHRGTILTPPQGWTTHHSIVEYKGRWYLFYHDASMSGGINHKRSVKMAEITYNADGTINTIDP